MRIRWPALILALGLSSGAPSARTETRFETLAIATAPPRAGELRVRFMGVTTLLFDDGRHAVMIDGFFSRPGLARMATGKIEPDLERIDEALARAEVTRLDAVLTAHSHHDHAMDSAAVVKRWPKALLIGSRSTANIGRGADIPKARIRTVRGGEAYCFGDFTVTVLASRHAFPNLIPGRIGEALRPPAHVTRYREGGSFSFIVEHRGRSFLIHPSAGSVPGLMAGVRADVVFLGIGGLGRRSAGSIRDYWREIVRPAEAGLVIPIHWDDFTKPLGRGLEPGAGFERTMKVITGLAKDEGRSVRLMPLFGPVALPVRKAGPAAEALPGPAPYGDSSCRSAPLSPAGRG
jgi:L-ascorbate metabolism protein UlaG (beta-lactamase superfamily)